MYCWFLICLVICSTFCLIWIRNNQKQVKTKLWKVRKKGFIIYWSEAILWALVSVISFELSNIIFRVFFNFAESVCRDNSEFCDYFGTAPFKFYNLTK